jgi:hypothetical protein
MTIPDYDDCVAIISRKSEYYENVSTVLSFHFDEHVTNKIVCTLFTLDNQIDSCTKAVEMGNLNLLIFSHKFKFHRNFKQNNDGIIFDYTAYASAKYGHVNCLKYVAENHFNVGKDCIESAIYHGHLECVRYLIEIGCPFKQSFMTTLVMENHLECLRYLYKTGYKCQKKSIKHAEKKNHLEIVEFLRNNKDAKRKIRGISNKEFYKHESDRSFFHKTMRLYDMHNEHNKK